MGIPAEQVAVKTSEKDELKEVDDTGGLMARDCQIRYIITKQALQEGWDCAFAYVLTILTDPKSKNALTQLVGRILRQPNARKTKVKALDESYVFCFRQGAENLLTSIRNGFDQEGLGDLRSHIASEGEEGGIEGERGGRIQGVRGKFKEAAARTLLPVFVARDGSRWRPVNYEMDIAARIPWHEVDLQPVLSLTLSPEEEKDTEQVATLAEDTHELVKRKAVVTLREGGVQVDRVFMTRQLCDIVPNPWQAHAFARSVLDHLRTTADDQLVANNFVFIIEELRRHLAQEKERLAEQVFRSMLDNDDLRFLVIGNHLNWTFPSAVAVRPGVRTLNRRDGSQMQMNLFEFVSEDEFNETERAVAWFLEDQRRLFFWYRNRVRDDYSIQGWREHRIYPDFIFTARDEENKTECDRVYVVETKGLHLKDNDKTNYIRKVFDICTSQAESRTWTELGLETKGAILRFEVLAEDEWQAKLNQLLT
jgi:type III restriction enzyme